MGELRKKSIEKYDTVACVVVLSCWKQQPTTFSCPVLDRLNNFSSARMMFTVAGHFLNIRTRHRDPSPSLLCIWYSIWTRRELTQPTKRIRDLIIHSYSLQSTPCVCRDIRAWAPMLSALLPTWSEVARSCQELDWSNNSSPILSLFLLPMIKLVGGKAYSGRLFLSPAYAAANDTRL